MHYQGEEHPVARKRVVVVALDHLPLKSEAAVHKFKLLAGPRWSPEPPKDAGVSEQNGWGNGYIKISCEDFPNAAMNLKWASDTLDKLVAESNVSWAYFVRLVLMFAGRSGRICRCTSGHAPFVCQGAQGKEGRPSARSCVPPTVN